MPVQDPRQLRQVYAQLEEANLFLIQVRGAPSGPSATPAEHESSFRDSCDRPLAPTPDVRTSFLALLLHTLPRPRA